MNQLAGDLSEPDQDDTLQLLRRMHDGDQAAFAELIERDHEWIYAHVRSKLHNRLVGISDFEDIVHDAITKALRFGPRFEIEGKRNFRALLGKIAQRTIYDRGRRSHLEPKPQGASGTVLRIGRVDETGTTPYDNVSKEEDQEWALLGLQLLPPTDRSAIYLRQWEDRPFAEIGVRLGLSADAARQRYRRALAKLAKLLPDLRAGRIQAIEIEPGSTPRLLPSPCGALRSALSRNPPAAGLRRDYRPIP